MNKYCYIDFEFNKTSEPNLNMVSGAWNFSDKDEQDSMWLYRQGNNQIALKKYLERLNGLGYIFVAYAVTAEARSFMSLHMKGLEDAPRLDPKKFKWIDLYLEYRCLLNHDHSLMYGRQLIGGKKITTRPPSGNYDDRKKSSVSSSKPEFGLAAACYNLLGEEIDTEHKDFIRNIIIQDNDIEHQKAKILEYNISDIKYLKRLHMAINGEYKKRLPPERFKLLERDQLRRGEYAARTAIMESVGYPIDFESTRNFSQSVSSIIWELQNEINELFPDIHPFKKKRDRSFRWDQRITQDWIKSWLKENQSAKWTMTATGRYSMALDAFKKHFKYSHDYPKDCFGAQIVRYLNMKQQLNGFSPNNTKRNFWDYVGSDKRVRPYFGIYGAQSARSQPQATGFLFLKSAWMRSLCVPPKGKTICGIDYKSQEFLLAALMSKDENMIKAYYSGDPYLYLGKETKAIPKDGTKKTHPVERDIFKTVTLALQYGMGPNALAAELTVKLGKRFTVPKAERLISLFGRVYPDYTKAKKMWLKKYRKQRHIRLPCGWYMWGDNRNDKSVQNVPVQGFGSSIMRKAVAIAQDRGLNVIFTLHDAIYIEYDDGHDDCVAQLANSMQEAFDYYCGKLSPNETPIGLDANIWSQAIRHEEDREIANFKDKVKSQPIYVDERGINEYEQFKKYFVAKEIDI